MDFTLGSHTDIMKRALLGDILEIGSRHDLSGFQLILEHGEAAIVVASHPSGHFFSHEEEENRQASVHVPTDVRATALLLELKDHLRAAFPWL
jgi:hypothetical protein